MMRFDFWRRWLLIASAVFALQGALWAVLGSFDPFGYYTRLLGTALWDLPELPPDGQRAFEFMMVPLGATTAGYFVLVHMLVRKAFPRREPWAYWTVVGALLTWFFVDSSFSLVHGAAFNVWLVNVPCVLVLGMPLAFIRRAFTS
jgi:hypothetical protein